MYHDLHLSLQPEGSGFRYVWSSKSDPSDIWYTDFAFGPWEHAEKVAHETMGKVLAATGGKLRPFRFPPRRKLSMQNQLTGGKGDGI